MIDTEMELASLLSAELAKEIDAQILKDLMALSDKRYVRKEKIENLYSLYYTSYTS